MVVLAASSRRIKTMMTPRYKGFLVQLRITFKELVVHMYVLRSKGIFRQQEATDSGTQCWAQVHFGEQVHIYLFGNGFYCVDIIAQVIC